MEKLYSEDRESLAQEIRETLRSRGFWCPCTSGPDLITAVALALDAKNTDKLLSERADIEGLTR